MAAPIMESFNIFNMAVSAMSISALLATGAFIQKSKDNSLEIINLKDRVTRLEAERVEITSLNVKLTSLESVFRDFKKDLKEDFQELKEMLRVG